MTYYHLDPNTAAERLAKELERARGYRVLRALPTIEQIWCRSMPLPTKTITLGVLDTETTGLDPTDHKMIELALAKLTICAAAGDVVNVGPATSWLEDPGVPLTPEIEALTGLTDAELAGQQFDEGEIARALANVDVIVAHNAAFDLRFFRQRFPGLRYPWACSMTEIDWPAHGLGGVGNNVSGLLTSAGHYVAHAHRAGPDAWALLCLLAMPASEGRAIAAHLVQKAKRPSARLFADRAPFELKDRLKAAGYRWSPLERAWWTEGEPERMANEATWLTSLHPAVRPRTVAVDWYSRHLG
ncbi:MAG: DNA polymerase III subunit epsilon [Sphingomonas sp.]|nr:DNA polymerase III subunit epsilon [Sphingomonas sp.]OQW48254.1 MAG: hypothetical protein A4S16_00885 [Proteobacteria bacterium SG_bin6]